MIADSFLSLVCKGNLLPLDQPRVMGILNLTEDSFYAGSRVQHDEASLLDRAGAMLEAGADLLDLGACSTRPGANPVEVSLESDRIQAGVEAILKHFPEALISVDTYRALVAQIGIQAGACMINDIAGGTMDPAMHSTVLALQVPYVLGHLRGNPATMQSLTEYRNVSAEVFETLLSKAIQLQNKGAKDIVLDPCFGFAKTREQNFEILANLRHLTRFRFPVMAGISRKSMVYQTLKVSAEQALNGTTAMNTVALLQGAKILRVHDVLEAVQCVQLCQQMPSLYPSILS
ncbi:MAG: hypothetical protein RLZZ617_13 [Bacteroidota bacterium]|jgi:dihydropteroate synthase